MGMAFLEFKNCKASLECEMRNSCSRSVHVSDCFDGDKQNIVHIVAYICLQVMRKYLKSRKHTLKNIDKFFCP